MKREKQIEYFRSKEYKKLEAKKLLNSPECRFLQELEALCKKHKMMLASYDEDCNIYIEPIKETWIAEKVRNDHINWETLGIVGYSVYFMMDGY